MDGTEQHDTWDMVRVLIVILIATITSTILLISFTDATIYDTGTIGSTVTINPAQHDCPHAMLISPINNSIVDTRDVTLTGYVYDNDDTIWFLNTTFYDYSTNNSITKLTSRTEFNISTVWTDRTPGETYKWYMYVENGTANYTSGVYYFTVSQDIVGTASDFYGTWLLLGIMLLLFVLAIVFKSVILAVAAMITSLFSTITYANTIMEAGSIFDDTMLYIFIFITMAVFLDIIYLVFSKERRY